MWILLHNPACVWIELELLMCTSNPHPLLAELMKRMMLILYKLRGSVPELEAMLWTMCLTLLGFYKTEKPEHTNPYGWLELFTQFAKVCKFANCSTYQTSRFLVKMWEKLCILIVFGVCNHRSRFTVAIYLHVFHVPVCLSIGVICVHKWVAKKKKKGSVLTLLMH